MDATVDPRLARPFPRPAVATAVLDLVLVELTRPVDGRFHVHVFDESVSAPAGDVVEAHVFYGIGVAELGRRLERAWEGLAPMLLVGYAHWREYRFDRDYRLVAGAVEALRARYES